MRKTSFITMKETGSQRIGLAMQKRAIGKALKCHLQKEDTMDVNDAMTQEMIGVATTEEGVTIHQMMSNWDSRSLYNFM